MERGIINRKTLAREVKITYSKLVSNAHLKSLLRIWNDKIKAVGIKDSKWDLLPRKIREYLTTAHATNTLPVHHEKTRTIISRISLARRFEFPPITFVRHKELQTVVAEFDAQIDPAKYPRKSKYDYLEESIRKLVASDDVVMYRGQIDKVWLARTLGVKPEVLKFITKYNTIIANANSTIRLNRTSLELDPLVACHNRRYDFYQFAEAYGIPFTLRLARAFSGIATRFASGTSKQHYNAIYTFLSYIQQAHPTCCAEIQSGIISRDTLERITWKWREEYLSEHCAQKPTSNTGRIKALNVILNELSDAQLLPKLQRLSPVPNARRHSAKTPSFGEMCAGADVPKLLENQCISEAERDAWLHSLRQERDNSPDLPQDTLAALQSLNHRRRVRLREIAQRQMQRSYDHFVMGQGLISSSDLTGEQIAQRVRALSQIPSKRGTGLNELFPRENINLARSRFLNFLLFRFGACFPTNQTSDELGQFWSKAISRLGGVDYLESCVCATTPALVAAATLYLEETAANVSVALSLAADPFTASEIPGYTRIIGFKGRARGKPISADLPDQSKDKGINAVQALKMIQIMTARLRANADADAEYLFIGRGHGGIRVLPEFALTNGFKEMLREDDMIGTLDLLPSMIRTTVLLDKALKDDGKLFEAQLIAHHSSLSTTSSYTNRFPIRLLYEQKMRQFQGQFQAVVVNEIEDAATKLGLSSCEMATRYIAASRSGLGTICGARSKQPDQQSDNPCTKLESCCGCMHMFVVAEAENIADLISWNESLKSVQDAFSSTNPERWSSVWLPWLVFTQVVIEQLLRGPNAAILGQAKEVLADRRAHDFRSPAPW